MSFIVSPKRKSASYGCGAALFAAFSDQLLIVPVTPLPAPAPMSVTAVEVAEGIDLWYVTMAVRLFTMVSKIS
eukprot:SAG31_NODE_29753_length_390_cov_0.955326_1_plen_72_part_10